MNNYYFLLSLNGEEWINSFCTVWWLIWINLKYKNNKRCYLTSLYIQPNTSHLANYVFNHAARGAEKETSTDNTKWEKILEIRSF